MLAIFNKSYAHAPLELNGPDSSSPRRNPDEILASFHASDLPNAAGAFTATFGGGAALACSRPSIRRQSQFSALEGVFCVFSGHIDNLSALIRQYGLCGKAVDEALLLIEIYRTLRDRGPYPADQVVRDLSGSFAFVVFDSKAKSVFSALSSDGGQAQFYWGLASDGSVVISDELEVVKGGCGNSFAPFPPGCMFHSEGGLRSFEHPMCRMKATPWTDGEGVARGATFKVDHYSRVNSVPRVGSAADWTTWPES